MIEILRTVVGSGLHGIAIEGTDDHDEMGIFIEPPDAVLGLSKRVDSISTRTQPEGVRSGPGDVDLMQYSLRKYLKLAVQGNPTILLPLFAPSEAVITATIAGHELRLMHDRIVSQKAGPRFVGYMLAQILSLKGQRKRPARPELVEQYGYDVKFASHALRLGIQGYELFTEGMIHLPMKPEHIIRIRDIKTGKVPEAEVMAEVEEVSKRLAEAVETGGVLRPQPDVDAINTWSVTTHLLHWSSRHA